MNSSLGFKQFSSISPQWEMIPSLTAYVKSRFCLNLSVSSSNSILSTSSSPFFSCQKLIPKSLLEISDNIFSPSWPKGLWPTSCATAMAFVNSVFKPKFLAIV